MGWGVVISAAKGQIVVPLAEVISIGGRGIVPTILKRVRTTLGPSIVAAVKIPVVSRPFRVVVVVVVPRLAVRLLLPLVGEVVLIWVSFPIGRPDPVRFSVWQAVAALSEIVEVVFAF